MLLATLTSRERDTLEMICDGYTQAEIAEELGIGREGVAQRMIAIRTKLQARNTTHAAVLAIRSGLIERQAA